MIVRVPNDAVLKWLYPDMWIEPRCYLEIDICWDGRVYIEPHRVVSIDDVWERKFGSKERAELRRYVTLDNSVSPICGKWRVRMNAKWLFWFRNVKYIWQNIDGSIQGYNVLWGWRKWGDFWVQKQGDKPQYGFFYKYFTDGVYLHDDNEASGVLSTKPNRKRKPDKVLASFTMTRILPKQIDK